MKPTQPEEAPLTYRDRWLLVSLPVLGLTIAYLLVHWISGPGRANEMAAATGASMAGLGTTVIFGAAILGGGGFQHLSAVDIAATIFVFNTALTAIYVGAADLLERLPWVGPKLANARRRAKQNARERPWIRRWAAVGVGLFVLSPLPGSGVVGGSVVGRVVGLTRKVTFASVVTANAIVCVLYAWGADALGAWMNKRQWSIGARIWALAGAVVFLFVLLKFATGGFARKKPKA